MIIKKATELKKYLYLLLLLIVIFFINLSIEYSKYKDFIDEEVYELNSKVLNIYKKESNSIFKLKNKNFTFYTKIEEITEVKKGDFLSLGILTLNISFLDFLRGFYTKTIYYEKIDYREDLRKKLVKITTSQHHNEMITELYNALFFAIPISSKLRQICTNYGISHLIALSGFHLAVLSFIIYWFLYFPYKFLQERYFPYRNRKFDILIISLILLFGYLLLTGIVPSLLRAFVMMCLGIYFLRSNIKIFSFLNLFLVFLIIVSFFPNYIFSLSLWFSIFAVFYILLYIQYFINIKSKIIQILFFNVWIFLVMNPIVHFFFSTTTYEQLLSPVLTILFTFFYPISLIFHFIDSGFIFDKYLLYFFSYEFKVFEVWTNLYFFITFLIVSFLSIFSKYFFFLLNLLLVLFTVYLYF